jgi:hypothetical protein
MAVVDRIECPAKNPEFFQTILFVATALWAVFVSGSDMESTVTL